MKDLKRKGDFYQKREKERVKARVYMVQSLL